MPLTVERITRELPLFDPNIMATLELSWIGNAIAGNLNGSFWQEVEGLKRQFGMNSQSAKIAISHRHSVLSAVSDKDKYSYTLAYYRTVSDASGLHFDAQLAANVDQEFEIAFKRNNFIASVDALSRQFSIIYQDLPAESLKPAMAVRIKTFQDASPAFEQRELVRGEQSWQILNSGLLAYYQMLHLAISSQNQSVV